jgi:hypothetical protein
MIEIDTTDAEVVARLLGLLGYSHEAVLQTVIAKCSIHPDEARAIVDVAFNRLRL